MMYKNLKAEMARNSVRGKDIAKALGTSSVNPKACMKYVNQTILEFFDGYLKGEPINLPKEEVITIK